MDHRDYDERYGPPYRQYSGEWERGEWDQPERHGERAYGDPYDRAYTSRGREYGPRHGGEPRGLIERATDEMRSWFGDEDAERRREQDERQYGRSAQRGRFVRDANPDFDQRRWARQWGYIDPSEDRARGSWGRETGVYPGVPSEARTGWRDPRGSGASREEGVYPGVPAEARGWSDSRSWLVEGPFTGRGPRSYRRSDERIREDVCDRLWQHGGIDASDVEVRVTDGEVILQGTVDDRGQRRVAEAMAESVSGVQQVQNMIRVGRADRPAGEEWRREERAA